MDKQSRYWLYFNHFGTISQARRQIPTACSAILGHLRQDWLMMHPVIFVDALSMLLLCALRAQGHKMRIHWVCWAPSISHSMEATYGADRVELQSQPRSPFKSPGLDSKWGRIWVVTVPFLQWHLQKSAMETRWPWGGQMGEEPGSTATPVPWGLWSKLCPNCWLP